MSRKHGHEVPALYAILFVVLAIINNFITLLLLLCDQKTQYDFAIVVLIVSSGIFIVLLLGLCYGGPYYQEQMTLPKTASIVYFLFTIAQIIMSIVLSMRVTHDQPPLFWLNILVAISGLCSMLALAWLLMTWIEMH
jgi:hypothetical protein